MRPILFLITIILLTSSFPLSAKENKDLMKANYYYAHSAYFEAIPYFEKAAGAVNDPTVYGKLGDCYFVINELEKAAEAYGKAANIPGCSPATILRYGQLLMEISRYDDAARWLGEYQKSAPNERRVANMISGCNQAESMKRSMPPGVALFMPFNTGGSDFAPTRWKGKIVFASDTAIDVKKKTDTWTGRSYYNIFSVSCDDQGNCGNEFDRIADTKEVNIKYHNGPCTFSGDGKQMYYSRSRYNDNIFGKKSISNKDSTVLLEIMIASDFDTVTKKFKTITPFQYNSATYSVAYPAVNPNGKVLVFSSNMPKGAGGTDLYMCRKIGNTWSKPQNLGNVINTEGEEVFPYWADERVLYFSSDGHMGLGGLDVYKMNWEEKTGSFSAPENKGQPINSSYDDISLALYRDDRSAYFSSNRPAIKGGDNIYYYKRQALYLQVNVIDSLTLQPLGTCDIKLESVTPGRHNTSGNTSEFFSRLYPQEQYMVSVSKDTYSSKQIEFLAAGNRESDTIFRVVKLYKPQPPPRENIDPIPVYTRNRNVMDTPGIRVFERGEIYELGHFYYDYDKYDLKTVHKVILDTLMAQLLRHPTMRIQIRSHTDCRGTPEYNETLSRNRALAVVNYLIEHGIKKSRLEYIGLGFSMPTIPCPDCSKCTEKEHYLNRILEFKVLDL